MPERFDLWARLTRAGPALFIYAATPLIWSSRTIWIDSFTATHVARRCGRRTQGGGANIPSIARCPNVRSIALRPRDGA